MHLRDRGCILFLQKAVVCYDSNDVEFYINSVII